MAKVTFNESVAGFRGKIGGLVYREHYGQTVIAPHAARKDQPSAAQRNRRARFRAAQAYAASVLADPLKRECYRTLALARKCPPNALLVANFLNPPTIEQVDFAEYQGRAGDTIRVLAADLIEVTGVTVVVCGADGTAIESGAAAKDHDLWLYRCTQAHAAHRPLRLEVTAHNRAKAKATETIPLP